MNITYANGRKGRIICRDRPNTAFKILSMDETGTLYHHIEGGYNNLDRTASGWDIDLRTETRTLT